MYGPSCAARVECQVVQDLASVGLTKKEIYDIVEEDEEIAEELCEMFEVE